MVIGEMNARREFRVTVQVRDDLGITHDVPAIVDTGFDSYITLPDTITRTLGLLPNDSAYVVLGDGSEREVLIYPVTLLWDGQERTVDAYGMEGIPLLGTRLLYGMIATMQFTDGGPLVMFRP